MAVSSPSAPQSVIERIVSVCGVHQQISRRKETLQTNECTQQLLNFTVTVQSLGICSVDASTPKSAPKIVLAADPADRRTPDHEIPQGPIRIS